MFWPSGSRIDSHFAAPLLSTPAESAGWKEIILEVLVEYEVLEGMEAEADAVRTDFLKAVEEWDPERFTYRVLQKGPEGRNFIHLAWLDSKETQQRLFETQFFKEFDAGMQRVSGGSVRATPLIEWTP